MANMVIPNEGKKAWLDRCLQILDIDPSGFLIGLYINNVTPGNASAKSAFDLATFTGSDPIPLVTGDWPNATIVANVAVSTLNTAPEWTSSDQTSQTVYGWILWGIDSDTLYAAQRFDNPRVMDFGSTEALDPFAIKLKTFS